MDSGRVDCGEGVMTEIAYSSYCAFLPRDAPEECPYLQPNRFSFGGVIFCSDNPQPTNDELGAALTTVVEPDEPSEPLIGDIGAPEPTGGAQEATLDAMAGGMPALEPMDRQVTVSQIDAPRAGEATEDAALSPQIDDIEDADD